MTYHKSVTIKRRVHAKSFCKIRKKTFIMVCDHADEHEFGGTGVLPNSARHPSLARHSLGDIPSC